MTCVERVLSNQQRRAWHARVTHQSQPLCQVLHSFFALLAFCLGWHSLNDTICACDTREEKLERMPHATETARKQTLFTLAQSTNFTTFQNTRKTNTTS
jgi:hypothetical protein